MKKRAFVNSFRIYFNAFFFKFFAEKDSNFVHRNYMVYYILRCSKLFVPSQALFSCGKSHLKCPVLFIMWILCFLSSVISNMLILAFPSSGISSSLLPCTRASICLPAPPWLTNTTVDFGYFL